MSERHTGGSNMLSGTFTLVFTYDLSAFQDSIFPLIDEDPITDYVNY